MALPAQPEPAPTEKQFQQSVVEVARTLKWRVYHTHDSRRSAAGFPDLVLTRGGHRILLTEPLPPSPERIRLGVVEYAPTHVLDGIKSLSYGGNMLCSRLARERGFDEALLVTPQGSVLEAPTSSLFWVDEFGAILTPPLSEHILASITRDRVMRVAAVEERPCTMDDLRVAGEAFLASTTREAQSIAAIEEFELPDGERTHEVAAALRQLIDEELAAG